MKFSSVLHLALEIQATDVHLESGLPPTFRVNGSLRRGTQALNSNTIHSLVQEITTSDQRTQLQTSGSVDLTRAFGKLNCRIHLMQTDRGSAIAIRILRALAPRLATSKLHPCLAELIQRESGLILLTGPTGSGKSTTLAAMLEEMNVTSNRHIVTLESPIEYRLDSKKSLIRQREVGRHTPSYEQGLMDCLREDPDVIGVGEMREPETMRLALAASATGHLVLATLHASNWADAVYRMMMAFPPEIQPSVLAQLSDSLVAIISQKISYRSQEQVLVPILEILVGTHASKNIIRKGDVTKLITTLQTGGTDGQWTFDRYQSWVDSQKFFLQPELIVNSDFEQDHGIDEIAQKTTVNSQAPSVQLQQSFSVSPRKERVLPATQSTKANISRPALRGTKIHKDGRIEIPEIEFDLHEMARSIVLKGEIEEDDPH